MPAAAKNTAAMVCTESFSAQNKRGDQWTFRKGELVRGNHAVMKEYSNFFEPADAHLPDVESATAAPGEKRGA